VITCLRQGKSTRMPRSLATDRCCQIPEMVCVHVRPPEVNDRVMSGHRDGDLIKGTSSKSAVGVLVERSSCLVLMARMPDRKAAPAVTVFVVRLYSIAAPMRHSLVCDPGRNMSRHAELARATSIRVSFCDPRSLWQHGTCENTTDLLLQYLPEGTDLSV
jgi:transposase, IS30 family